MIFENHCGLKAHVLRLTPHLRLHPEAPDVGARTF